MLREAFRTCRIRAVLFTMSSFVAYHRLFALCRQAGVAVITYEAEYPVLENWDRVLTGGYFDGRTYLRWTLPHADGLVGISRFWAAKAKALNLPFMLVPSSLPEELSYFTKPPTEHRSQTPGQFHLVTLGRWVPRERPLTLLRAVKRAYEMGVPIRYTAIGNVGQSPSEYRAMRYFRNDGLLRQLVSIAGSVDEASKLELLKSADVFVLLRSDSVETAALFPTRLPEYLVHGHPVIVSEAGDLACYLEHGSSAWVVGAHDDVDEVATALATLFKSPDLACRIGLGGFAKALETFSIESNGRKISEFIYKITRGCRTEDG